MEFDHIDQTLSAWRFAFVGIFSTAVFAVLVGLSAGLLALVYKKGDRSKYYGHVVQGVTLGFALGTLAWVSGYLTGASRVSAVGDVLPAVLGSIGVVGGLVSLRFGHSVQISIIVLCFGFSLFVGATTGAEIREQHELVEKMPPSLEFLKHKSRMESDLKDYREALGLEGEPNELSAPESNDTDSS